jgi:uncharacterized membrane protein
MVGRFLAERRGYSLTWTAAFLAFLLVPLLVLGIEIGRWEHARGELYKAADLAALAAAAEVDIPHFRDTGEVRLLPGAADVARRYVAANTGYLTRNGISAHVAGIGVDQGRREVQVSVVADVSRLFPAWVPAVTITGRGTAEVRGMAR